MQLRCNSDHAHLGKKVRQKESNFAYSSFLLLNVKKHHWQRRVCDANVSDTINMEL